MSSQLTAACCALQSPGSLSATVAMLIKMCSAGSRRSGAHRVDEESGSAFVDEVAATARIVRGRPAASLIEHVSQLHRILRGTPARTTRLQQRLLQAWLGLAWRAIAGCSYACVGVC